MVREIHLVCGNNVQRSPTGEAVLTYLSNQKQLPLLFRSSGIRRKHVLQNELSEERIKEILQAGLEYEIIPLHLDEEVKKAINQQTPYAQLQKLHGEIRPLLAEKNILYRNQALQERRIPYTSLKQPTPFEKVGDLFIPVNTHVQQELTEQSILYSELAECEELIDTPNGKIQGARRQVEYFLDTGNKALKNISEKL